MTNLLVPSSFSLLWILVGCHCYVFFSSPSFQLLLCVEELLTGVYTAEGDIGGEWFYKGQKGRSEPVRLKRKSCDGWLNRLASGPWLVKKYIVCLRNEHGPGFTWELLIEPTGPVLFVAGGGFSVFTENKL